MNILFTITRADAIGSAHVYVRDLAVALQQDRHKVLVLTGQEGAYNQYLKEADLESVACDSLQRQIDPIGDGKSLRYMLHIIDLFKPDVIAAHSGKAGILSLIAGRMSNVPCVFTAHSWSFTPGITEPNRRIHRWRSKLLVPLASKIICASEFDRQIGLLANSNPQKLLTIHNGIKDITPQLSADPTQSDPVRIAMVARFDPPQDHLSLIQAVKDLDAELILVGDGPNLVPVQRQVEKLGISNKVKFLGLRQDIAQILSEVQIFTLISKFEALPCTIIEAMRAGLPVVASDIGGIKEIVIDQQTGYIIPRGDTQTLRQKLKYLIGSEQARISMGIMGRQKYEAQLTFKHMYEQTLSVYTEAIATRSQVATSKSV
ncbi:MAG: glycosyltransferase family 4 protein [Cyanobacteria bacterium P01_G01_bin.39]